MSELPPALILAVDDDVLVLDLLISALSDGGYNIVEALGAEEAFDVLEAQAKDLHGLVTDVNLGRGQPNGWTVATRARELNPDIDVIYVTGDSSHKWASNGVPRSILLCKPFTPADVVVAVASARAKT